MSEPKDIAAGVEDRLGEAIAELDEQDMHRVYWNQNEFVLLHGSSLLLWSSRADRN